VQQHGLAGQVWIEAEVLRQIAELGPQPFGTRQHVLAVQRHPAGGRFEQAGENAHEGRFARAIGAEQAEHAGRQVEIDALESGHRAGIYLDELANGQHAGPSESRAAEGLCLELPPGTITVSGSDVQPRYSSVATLACGKPASDSMKNCNHGLQKRVARLSEGID
jgi:hypothetical protein